MKLYRLLPSIPGSWGRFEDFQMRMRVFAERFHLEAPIEPMLHDLTQKWINAPLSTGYWIVYDDSGLSCAHLCSYIADHYGQPYVSFYQTEIEHGGAREIFHQVGPEIAAWVKGLNVIYERANPANPLRITHGESTTWIEPQIYERLFRAMGFPLKASRTVFRWELT